MRDFLKDEVKRQAIATAFRVISTVVGGLIVGLLLIYYFKG